MKKMHISVMGVLLLFVSHCFSSEYIKSYDSHIIINKDGSLDITETIVAYATGYNIRRGIYRDFPTYYKGRNSFSSVIVPFDVQQVLVDGKEILINTESISRGKRVYLGNAYLKVPGYHTFVLKYRTARQLGFFEDHDELFFNGIGTDWMFAIKQATITVVLPQEINAHNCKTLASVGYLDSQERSYTVKILNKNTLQFKATRQLRPYEGFTFTVGFKKGVIAPPTAAQRQASFFRDNSQGFIFLLFLLLLLIFLIFSYNKIQSSRPPRNVIPRFEPPKDFTPGMVNYFNERKVIADTLSSDIVAMAVNGFIEIETKEEGLIFSSTVYTLTRTEKEAENNYYKELLGQLFKKSQIVKVGSSYNKAVERLFDHSKWLCGDAVKKFFDNHLEIMVPTIVIGVGSFLTQFLISGFLDMPFIESIAFSTVLIHGLSIIISMYLFRLYTKEGYQLKDEIDGFKLYLETAERERLKFVSTPPKMTPQHYETLLPYAMALGVEELWTKQFTPVFEKLERAGTPYHPYWYHGRPFRSSAFSRSFRNNMRPALSSSIGAKAPGSVSGFSSGSSSGRGGGGGGGGGF